MRQDFREIVKQEMIAQDVSRYRLAQMINVSWPTINRWLNGETNINHRALESVFESLKITVIWP